MRARILTTDTRCFLLISTHIQINDSYFLYFPVSLSQPTHSFSSLSFLFLPFTHRLTLPKLYFPYLFIPVNAGNSTSRYPTHFNTVNSPSSHLPFPAIHLSHPVYCYTNITFLTWLLQLLVFSSTILHTSYDPLSSSSFHVQRPEHTQ